MKQTFRNVIGIFFGIPFVLIGYDHFISPETYDPLVPDYMGSPRFWTILSGIFEIILGLGVTIPFTRIYSAKSLALLLITLYLANLNMWLNDIPFNGAKLSQIGHLIRFIIQVFLVLVCFWLAEINFKKFILKVMKKALPKEIFRALYATANPSHSARTARIIGFRITAPSIALFCFRLALSLVLCVSHNGHWYCQRHRKELLMQKGWRWRFFIEAVALCQSAKWWRFFFIMIFFFQTEAYLRLVIP